MSVIITYRTETRPDTSKTQRNFRIQLNEDLNKGRGKALQDRAICEEIWHICRVENLSTWVKHRKGEWNQYISRMPE